MIVVMQGHIGVPELLASFGLPMLVFKPEWKAAIEAGPRSMLRPRCLLWLFVTGAFVAQVIFLN
jgi:hypothetical protein